MNIEDTYIKFELKSSDINWFDKLQNKLWTKNYDYAKKIHYLSATASLQSNEWHGILALINIYDLPLVLKEGNSIHDIRLEIYNHSACIGTQPEVILRLSPYHFRTFTTSYDINAEIKLFLRHILPLIDAKRNKELLNVYGLRTIKEDRLFSIRCNYLY